MAKQTGGAGKQFIVYDDSLANNSDLTVTGTDIGDGKNAVITTYVVNAACDVKMEFSTDGFATTDATITLDSFSGNGIAEEAHTPLIGGFARLLITNTSGSSDAFGVIGFDGAVPP